MKKVLILLVVAALLFCAGCNKDENTDPNGAHAGQPGGEQTPPETILVGTVYGAAVVNVRLEPSAESRILDTAMRGEMFKLVDHQADSEWHNVICGGDSAYISSDYLYVTEWKSGEALTIGTVVGSEEVVEIFSREDPESSTVLGALKGEKYLVIRDDEANGWYQLGFPGGSGYMQSQYLEVKDTTIENALS